MYTDNATSEKGVMPPPAELQLLMKGILLVNGDTDYDEVRKIWNGMIDRKPAFIARCMDTADIQEAVKFARKYNLLISVRGAGHNVSGNAVCDDGIMIDLSLMKAIKVDSAEKTALVEMGATWGDLDNATQPYGLATTGGVISTTGVAGLTLGGGVGWLVRKYGLSCDNLLEAEVVTADGKIVKASLKENADLLWGLRGGGGNFGIVSSMKLRLHDVGMVLGGMILYERKKAKDVIRFYREFVKTAPNELTLYSALLTSPDGIPVVALAGCYCGDPEKGKEILKPIREFETSLADLFQPIPYIQMQTMLNPAFPRGHRYYWKSGFLTEISDETIDILISHMSINPSPFSATLLEYYGGASTREPEGGTSYPHRQPLYDLVIVANWPDKSNDDENITWTRNVWEAMQSHLSHKVYVNTLGVEGEERIKEAYGENYDKLAQLKFKYDPENWFRMNQNIKPAK